MSAHAQITQEHGAHIIDQTTIIDHNNAHRSQFIHHRQSMPAWLSGYVYCGPLYEVRCATRLV